MKIAIVHDWLLARGGAERVLMRMHHLWPQAPIFTLAADSTFVRTWLPGADIRTSWVSRMPWPSRTIPLASPLLPSVIESFDLSGYDTVLSSSVLFAKGIITRTTTRHVGYCYSPSRPLWDRAHEYERRGRLASLGQHGLRLWDRQAAQRPDTLVAISETVRGRIQKYYRRDAEVIYPGLLDGTEVPVPEHDGFYLAVGRLVPHKRFLRLSGVFEKLKRKLVIVGNGPLERSLRHRQGPYLKLVTSASDAQLAGLYRSCRALIVPNEEDFGLTPIEAMAYGKPAIALRAGGATETVTEGISGEFFDDPIPESIADAIIRCEQSSYDAEQIAATVAHFRVERFDEQLISLVNSC